MTRLSRELIALAEAPVPTPPARDRQIFCNRDLNLATIQWVGFDMDYTLAIYHREALDELAHRLTLEAMVRDLGYPEEICSIPFDHDFAIRGLVIDTERGHILKMDAHQHVLKGTHGFRVLSDEERAGYRKSPPKFSEREPRFNLLDTLFELPEAYLYAALVDHLEKQERRVNYARLANDIRDAIDSVHADGRMKAEIVANLPKYVDRDAELTTMLHRLRSSGKKLFLLTNSYPDYTEKVMHYLLDADNGSYTRWKGYFDVIISGARKPEFFRGYTPFYIVGDDGEIVGEEHVQLERGRIYLNGNIRDFERMIGLGADEILYIGDHIYGDILRSKRDSAWRTAMVIPEMEREMMLARTTSHLIPKWTELESELRRLHDDAQWNAQLLEQMRRERKALDVEAEASELQRLVDHEKQLNRDLEVQRKRSRVLLQELTSIEAEYDASFHPIWGSLFKQGNENSIFGQQVELYACLYTSRASNFFHVSPVRYFRSPRNQLPHEMSTDSL